ncbi:hypothetical protein [Fusibacter sp. JL216-2]|uniref:hypothetical protein n=1 Tax=Fusibacter sp. JL216-2 TaxID=3071453 RepID=UPI003D3289DB
MSKSVPTERKTQAEKAILRQREAGSFSDASTRPRPHKSIVLEDAVVSKTQPCHDQNAVRKRNNKENKHTS